MRHITFIEGARKVYDGQFECPFVVIGQRNEVHFRPNPPTSLTKHATEEDRKENAIARAAWAEHQRRITSGYFALTTIEWCETREEGEDIIGMFQSPEWVNVAISDQVQILRHSHS